MNKRLLREKREYLFKKASNEKEFLLNTKKIAIKQALNSSTALQNTKSSSTKELLSQLQYNDLAEIDNEYSYAGQVQVDPKVIITTSRDPSSSLTKFSKEMKLMFPNSTRINRGNYIIADIIATCRKSAASDLIIIHEHRGTFIINLIGKPDGLIISHLPHGPTCYFTLHNVVTRHEIPDSGTVSEQYPHLIFNKFTSKLGDRV